MGPNLKCLDSTSGAFFESIFLSLASLADFRSTAASWGFGGHGESPEWGPLKFCEFSRIQSSKPLNFESYLRVSINGGTPIAGWFISWTIPLKLGWWLGYPHFRKTSFGLVVDKPNNSKVGAHKCWIRQDRLSIDWTGMVKWCEAEKKWKMNQLLLVPF